jgi:hypothetical protein
MKRGEERTEGRMGTNVDTGRKKGKQNGRK